MTSPDTHLIRSLLGADGPQFDLLEAIDSTNRWLLDAPATHRPARPRAVLALAQHAGRGRRGRSWLAEPGRSLALSIAFERTGSAPAPGLSIAVGCEIAQALSTQGAGLALKWPNDLLRAGGKCGGILIESRPLRAGGEPRLRVVVGVGINLLAPLDALGEIAQPASGLFDHAIPDRLEPLIAQIILAVARAWTVHERDGLVPFLPVWSRFDAWHGQEVELSEAGRVIAKGRSLGIDASGALGLSGAAGEQWVVAGDLSLRIPTAQP